MEKREHIVIDATGHVAGKLAAKVAKRLLEGSRVTVVCAEETVFAGSLEKSVEKFKDYLHKRCVVNPRRGPFHLREPRMHLQKMVRRMMLYKTYRGREALKRLVVYEGIPRELENQERVKVGSALFKYTVNTSKNSRSVKLGTLLSMFGWKHGEITKRLTDELRERERDTLRKKEDSSAERLRETKEFQDEVSRRLALLA